MLGLRVANRIEDAICGKPAYWELTFNDLGLIWICAQHYEALIGRGWSEVNPTES